MRAFVLTDRSLARHAGRFVWLDVNTEKAANAALRKKFPISALPTFFVVDPVDEKVALRWVGGMTLAQLEKVLGDGAVAVAVRHGEPSPARAEATTSTPDSRAADDSFARAERLYGEGKNAEAADAYLDALAKAPDHWSHDARAIESLMYALSTTDRCEQAATLARDAYPRLRHTSSGLNVAASGLDCAGGLDSSNARRAELAATLEAYVREALDDSTLQTAADDRSGAYIVLIDARKAARDDAGAREAALAWSAFLDAEAARARTPEERMVFDPHRFSAYLEIGQPERAIPMLEASERDAPGDYNPPARLANTYRAMKRWDEALAASDRALAKAYGPRKILLYQNRADIHSGRGDRESAKQTLAEAVSFAEALPEGQRNQNTIASLRKKLEALEQSAH
jgi:tetratricopeptide (TPR) repeat protein